MKLSNRQLILGSLQPLLFCIAMYCVILFISVFLCSSIYNAFKTNKAAITETQTASVANFEHPAAATLKQ